jgi:tetratricopeptide (TPR) repeat protein
MQEVIELHNEAMDLASQAMLLNMQGEASRAIYLTREAFYKERQAALMIANDYDMEPTRSVLYRSAATLALECMEIREAERLISSALSGDPPDEIANELRDLLEQVYFQRHLSLRGVSLDSHEFQVSLTGEVVGFGIAQSGEFVERVKDIETMVYRVAERKLGKPFRERGQRSKKLRDEMELYLSVPRASSFAVTFRVGGNQLSIPSIGLAEEVIDDIFEGLRLFNDADLDALQKRIPQEAYFRNFVGLSRKIAPDGKKIKTVGLTTIRNSKESTLVIHTPQSNSLQIIEKTELPTLAVGEYIEIIGILKFADSRNPRNGLIQVVTDDRDTYKVRVPEGMMSDIVRPMFEDRVIITGYLQRDGSINLNEIKREESD